MEISMDFEEAVDKLFNSREIPANINFEISTPDNNVSQDEIYHQILLRGALKLYNCYSLVDLTDSQSHNLNRYMNALGVHAQFERASPQREIVLYDSDDEPYTSNLTVDFDIPVQRIKYTHVNSNT